MAPAEKKLPNVRGSFQEVLFAQRLADNEKKNRDKALKKLKTFLLVKSSAHAPGFTDEDAIKLWKGLFYCMYMADKPLVQEDVAEEISYLIHDLENLRDRRTFTKAAFETFAREWNGIDVFRMDKFMMFVRRVLRQVFVHLRGEKWNLAEVAKYVHILDTCVIRADDNTNKTPLGLKLHLCSIIMEELAKIGGEKLEHEVILAVIQPYLKVLALSKINMYRVTVCDEIIRHLIRQSDVGVQYEEGFQGGRMEIVEDAENEDAAAQDEDVEMDDERNEEDFVLDPRAGKVDACIPQLYPDYNLLAKALQSLGGLKKVSKVSRNLIYKLVKELQDTAQGVYPMALPEDDAMIDVEDPVDEEEEAIKRLQNFYENLDKPVETQIAEMGDLKENVLSKYSITKSQLKRRNRKKVKPTEKKILTFKEKKALARQQRAAELNRQKAVEGLISQITKVKVPSTTELPKEKKTTTKKASKRDKKRKKQRERNKVGGFEVSAITSDANNDKSEVPTEINGFEVSTITGKGTKGKKRKSQSESEKSTKKVKTSAEAAELPVPATPTELAVPPTPTVEVQSKKALKKKKQKAKKASKANVDNVCVGSTTGESSGMDSVDCKGEVVSKLTKAHLSKEMKGIAKESSKVNTTVGVAETIKSKGLETTKVSSLFEVPEFSLTKTEPVRELKSPAKKSSDKKAIQKETKTKSQESSKEKMESQSSEVKANLAGEVKNKSKSKLDKKTVVTPSSKLEKTLVTPSSKLEKTVVTPSRKLEKTVVTPSRKLGKTVVTPSLSSTIQANQKTPVLKSPLSKKPASVTKGLVMNISEKEQGSVWSQPLMEGDIDMFLKIRRQMKLDRKKNKSPARSSLKAAPRTPKEKTIKINLKENTEHDLKDYAHSIRNSPQIPFSADKHPKAPVLKPTSSPILLRKSGLNILKNVVRKASPSSKVASPALKGKSPKAKKLKRSKAADFF